jgi:hypothetical protein
MKVTFSWLPLEDEDMEEPPAGTEVAEDAAMEEPPAGTEVVEDAAMEELLLASVAVQPPAVTSSGFTLKQTVGATSVSQSTVNESTC